MILLPNLDVLEICFNFQNYSTKKRVFEIIFNSSLMMCFTKRYIDFLESLVSNKEAFQALIRELYDNNRIRIETTAPQSSLDEEFLEIATNCKISSLLPIKLDDKNGLAQLIPFLTIIENAAPINKHWIILELLSHNTCNVCYQDFKNDGEILLFFNNVFSIPKYIKNIWIFDREQSPAFLTKIKGKQIDYYTLFKGRDFRTSDRIQAKKDLMKILGGKLKLYYTNNPRLIHERKIIFEDILITIDNSQANLTISEPTWEILISLDEKKAKKWTEKSQLFQEINS